MAEEKEIEQWKREAREAAEEDIAKYGVGKPARVFTDGLGALGMGTSMTDPMSPAHVRQREYNRIMRGESP